MNSLLTSLFILQLSALVFFLPNTTRMDGILLPVTDSRIKQSSCFEAAPHLVACNNEEDLISWAREYQTSSSLNSTLPEETSKLYPSDPLLIQDGIHIYRQLLDTVARRNRSSLALWEHTPIFNASELEYFENNNTLWKGMVSFRAAKPGKTRLSKLRKELRKINTPQDRRHLVLRDGIFYFEDPATANWAFRNLKLKDLFDEDYITLERGDKRYKLKRRKNGHYYHTEQSMFHYRARLALFDRIGVTGNLGNSPSYQLDNLRRSLGIDHIEVGEAKEGVRSGEIIFLSGDRLTGHLIRTESGETKIGILVLKPLNLSSMLTSSKLHAEVIYGLTDTAESMMRENLFFDEPANEEGQQDGIMRLAFTKAVRLGEAEYTVNEVTYSIYDRYGRPRPPQVCVDLITDTVDRYTGSWWPSFNNKKEKAPVFKKRKTRIRKLMPARQVKKLVTISKKNPKVANNFSFSSPQQIPFEKGAAFFNNLFANRDNYRTGDVVVIYGKRADNKNHYHSFYVYNTDPVYGMPINLIDQAGHVRIRTWTDIMSSAPRRFIWHRVRWNPYWITSPEQIDNLTRTHQNTAKAFFEAKLTT